MGDYTHIILIIILVLVAVFFFGFTVGKDLGYRSGQIDALTGKQYYCLEKQPDLSLVWVEHEEGCKR